MNKIQYIELLNLRGVTELNGETIASAVKRTGGNPTTEEMVVVNERAMNHYIDLFQTQLKLRAKDSNMMRGMQEDVNFLQCLMAAGVEDWAGHGFAREIYERDY